LVSQCPSIAAIWLVDVLKYLNHVHHQSKLVGEQNRIIHSAIENDFSLMHPDDLLINAKQQLQQQQSCY
jgi:hypothetical protein